MRGKLIRSSDPRDKIKPPPIHRCTKPYPWPWRRISVGDIFECECGRQYRWTSVAPLWGTEYNYEWRMVL